MESFYQKRGWRLLQISVAVPNGHKYMCVVYAGMEWAPKLADQARMGHSTKAGGGLSRVRWQLGNMCYLPKWVGKELVKGLYVCGSCGTPLSTCGVNEKVTQLPQT